MPEDLHHHVVEAHVEVLGDLHVVDWHVHVEVGHIRDLAAAIAGEGDDIAPDLLGVFDGLHDVVGVPASGDRYDEVALAELAVELEEEDVLEAVVVGHRHEARDVVVEADESEFPGEFRGNALVEVHDHVARGRGAPPVAEDVDVASRVIVLEYAVHGRVELVEVERLDDPYLGVVIGFDVFPEVNHGCFSLSLFVEDYRASGLVELEWHLHEPAERGADSLFRVIVRHVEEEESASPCPEELPAGRAGLHRLFVAFVDEGVRDPAGQGALDLPVGGQARPDRVDVVGLEPPFELPGVAAKELRGLDLVEVAGHRPALVGEDGARVVELAGIEHHEVPLHPGVGFRVHDHGLHLDEAVGLELVEPEAAEGGGELVLFADGVAELLYLHLAGLLGELIGGDVFALVGIKQSEKGDREGA